METKQYLLWKRVYAPSAARIYAPYIRKFSNLSKETPTMEDVVKFHEAISKRYKPATVALAMTAVRNYLGYLLANGEKVPSPTLVKIPRFTPAKRVVVEPEDINMLASVLNEWEFYELELLVIVFLLWETGVRVSELCDLNISDIDSQKRETIIETKKSTQRRIVAWSKETHGLLLRYIGTRICLNNTPFLFISPKKGRASRITPRTVERWIEELRKKAGIEKKITPHSFRHGKAHQMLKMGAGIKDIQVVLGHSENNPSAAMMYIRLNERESAEIVRKYLTS